MHTYARPSARACTRTLRGVLALRQKPEHLADNLRRHGVKIGGIVTPRVQEADHVPLRHAEARLAERGQRAAHIAQHEQRLRVGVLHDDAQLVGAQHVGERPPRPLRRGRRGHAHARRVQHGSHHL